jgi:hypothetical protein
VQHGASQLIRGFIIADRLERQPRFHQKLPQFETQPSRAASFWLQIDAYSVP